MISKADVQVQQRFVLYNTAAVHLHEHKIIPDLFSDKRLYWESLEPCMFSLVLFSFYFFVVMVILKDMGECEFVCAWSWASSSGFLLL